MKMLTTLEKFEPQLNRSLNRKKMRPVTFNKKRIRPQGFSNWFRMCIDKVSHSRSHLINTFFDTSLLKLARVLHNRHCDTMWLNIQLQTDKRPSYLSNRDFKCSPSLVVAMLIFYCGELYSCIHTQKGR